MGDDSTAALGALRVDEEKLKGHVDEVVRSSVEETLNVLLDAEADAICGFHAGRPLIPAHAGLAFHAMPGWGDRTLILSFSS